MQSRDSAGYDVLRQHKSFVTSLNRHQIVILDYRR